MRAVPHLCCTASVLIITELLWVVSGAETSTQISALVWILTRDVISGFSRGRNPKNFSIYPKKVWWPNQGVIGPTIFFIYPVTLQIFLNELFFPFLYLPKKFLFILKNQRQTNATPAPPNDVPDLNPRPLSLPRWPLHYLAHKYVLPRLNFTCL